ncbi:hypothetical protein PanWU01x14_186950 [Parasponia andersonii]|uniref:Ulp1 protease family, C-terminal catalytic domain containing protein n=1 Tax=Parasponia andersonii TaxID=3476 RepID=A0A2P5C3J4_PARAD|nr:hypothetical protein PanWU01x14_186950 [Parasponia andersonii]
MNLSVLLFNNTLAWRSLTDILKFCLIRNESDASRVNQKFVKLKLRMVNIWNSIAVSRHKITREEATREMISLKSNVPQQSKGIDCDLFATKFMESFFFNELTAAGETVKNTLTKFVTHKAKVLGKRV